MKALCKTFLLMLTATGLASCGGGGGGGQSALNPTPADTISISASATSITTNSLSTLTVSVNKADGSAEVDGTVVNASLSPATIGTISNTANGAAGSTASSSVGAGRATFYFTSSDQSGTASITISVPASTGTSGSPYTATGAINITVTAGACCDPRLVLTPSTLTLPLNPFAAQEETGPNFPSNYLGSPYIAEVTVTRRHSNGQLIAGTENDNVSIDPVTIAGFSQLDLGSTAWTGETTTPETDAGNEFLTILGSGPIQVTGGNGVIFVHASDTPGTTVLTVTAIDPDNAQTISGQLTFTVAGAASTLPSQIFLTGGAAVYVSGSTGGNQSTLLNATVYDGNNALVPDPSGFDNVQFQIVGPANTDAQLSGINASGKAVVGTTVDTVTHNGVANISFLAGTVQGPVQVKVTADGGDNNVDNGIQNAVSATATVVVSDGKLFSLTIDSPDTGAVVSSGVSTSVTEDPAGSGNYELTISAKGVDRQGNPVLPGTVVGFGDVDSPQTPGAGLSPQNWFQISGSHGDPQEGGTIFTATDGHFTTAGGGAGPGDTLLVIGKASEGAPAGNDDLETSAKITAVTSATSLTVATEFNLNDRTGVSVNDGPVLPYIIGRATFSSVQSPSSTDATGTNNVTGVAVTTLNYPASEIGKAVAVWAQGTGTDTNSSPGRTDVVADVQTLVFPGLATGAVLTASPDPLLGNSQQAVTVCYYDGNNRPIPDFDISFAFNFNGVGSGSADGVSNSGLLKHLTGANGCVTVNVITASLPSTAAGSSTPPTITFSAGPANNTTGTTQASVVVPFVINAAQLQASCGTVTAGVLSVTLTLLDSSGNGVPGQTITGTCTGTGTSIVGAIPPTNSAGATTVNIKEPAVGTTGQCQFQDSQFPNIVATVNVTSTGAGTCTGGFSPEP
jgi:hypothetical protein